MTRHVFTTTYTTKDPTGSEAVIIEADPTLPEVSVSTFAAFDQPDFEAALDAEQVGQIVAQLTGWLAARAR
ncbi:hypothetical protein PBI_THONKO_93 [Mycobacterium phage Thonko]|uniref:Uncharacterized protein n=1 Tax=Mycobacterium phage Thonko TaxID=2282910 RepID=A0A346FCD8_9CAUD|nr:hypothetical protein I5G57_gp093 [Mycobacterium phage Thonko]AXN53363.1 hypothetical protein PBI_THONKO_93 [Mycobacterium phage Thonko]